jgi:hypothetical protein
LEIGDSKFADSDEVSEHLLKKAFELENKRRSGAEYTR